MQPVEIKSGQTITSDIIRAGKKSASIAGKKGLAPWLIYGGEESYERSGLQIMGWKNFSTY